MQVMKINGFDVLVDDAAMGIIEAIHWVVGEFGKKNKKLYACGWDKHLKKSVYLHRLIVAANKSQIVDHKNGNTLDNRTDNLRICTAQQNSANSLRKKSNSGFKGVEKYNKSNKFRARICLFGKMFTLGVTETPEEAARLYDIAASDHFGEFAVLNFSKAA